MVAHYHGQNWNGSEIASSLQIVQTTARGFFISPSRRIGRTRIPPAQSSLRFSTLLNGFPILSPA